MKWRDNFKDFVQPSKEDLEKELEYEKECQRLEIKTGVFDDIGIYTNDEIEAMAIIMSGERIPKELEKKLLDTKESRMKRWGSSSKFKEDEDGFQNLLKSLK